MYDPDQVKTSRESWLKVTQAAKVLRIHPDMIRDAVAARELEYRRNGERGHIWIEEMELHRWWKHRHTLHTRRKSISKAAGL